jgi:hypothetical protein
MDTFSGNINKEKWIQTLNLKKATKGHTHWKEQQEN